ncbi:MAG: hypothetical protein K9M44_04220 [Candidatus Pacebacteria bacterium]|nr:hypothetical protein [Candidatus Paceibacterota bacterium]
MKKIVIFFVAFLTIQVGIAQTIPTFKKTEELPSKFIGDIGFVFFEGATLVPVFYFHEKLLELVPGDLLEPTLYKGSEAPTLKKIGHYYYVQKNERIVPGAQGDVVILKANVYLGMKADGYQAWLAYELEAQSLYPSGDFFYVFDSNTGGIDIARKLKGYKKIE